ncbi:phosphotransferase enzyme family protein [Aspergillus nomiae NRRL 13137]|uniref:Phosphotransferase enzyme family protein n=1 Tax=Aspergillus nomiae NRRL (strain ATCC 15546 / NRRL 13137 / CBS 260.88 / M93) TaxID=1509407 RepID=A0A0L1J2F4_ASPN3|nr:phosphotransferase enzyme family protein [Aspergillus nomiae NRRL 13137]KNG85603.1 phosphotransferase enzyme family protein [Aspergillus nomiae NRRL 13137]
MPFSLPYYRDAGQLPGPLPDQNEIEQATQTLPERSDYGRRLVVIRDKYVVKYGPLVNENEGYALLFVEKRLNIPAPRLYAMYRDQDTLYIVMEYIPSISLGMAWPSLTEVNKHSIVGQLRCIFDQMRELPSLGFYGSVNGGPVPHRYFWSRQNDPAVTGPFQAEEEFGKAIALRSKAVWSESNVNNFLSDYLARHLPVALHNHPPMFTHGDLYRENVLVRKVVNPITNEEEYEVAALVDWETAGWYPSYWEYAHIFPLLQWVDDWPAYLEKILDPLPLEGAMMRLVFNHLEF